MNVLEIYRNRGYLLSDGVVLQKRQVIEGNICGNPKIHENKICHETWNYDLRDATN